MRAQSGWKCAGIPPPLSHAYLVGSFAAGAPAGHGLGDLDPRRYLVLMATTWGPGGGTHRRGERNRARPAKSRAHMHHVVTTTTLACRYARGSHLQGHMERVGRALTLTLNQKKSNQNFRVGFEILNQGALLVYGRETVKYRRDEVLHKQGYYWRSTATLK